MDARNRMADVIKLRCNACQEFLKLIIKDGWQQVIYNKAQKEVTTNGRYSDKYISVYEKMRDIGVDNYRIEDMDVTFISEVVHGCRSIAPTEEKTRKAIEQLTEDRNIKDHSSENEDEEEIYLQGLLALCNLRKFIRIVDRFEAGIEDEERLLFRSTYICKIELLKDKLDEERIALVQRIKDIEKDINLIIKSENRLKTWSDIHNLYSERYCELEKDYEHYYEFIVKASDAGIVEAHVYAIDYFMIKKNYDEGEKRLFMLFNSSNKLGTYYAKHIIDSINHYLIQGNIMTEGMEKLVDGIIDQGYLVSETSEGLLDWKKKK